MSDLSSQQLVSLINNAAEKNSLWFIDEAFHSSCLAAIQPRDNLTIISNRFDLHQQALALGLNSTFSDFDCPINGVFDAIFLRVAKEKSIVHYLINRAADLLKVQGVLTLIGEKNEGTKTYIDKAKKFFGSSASAKKNNIIYTGEIRFYKKGIPLPDKSYTQLQTISGDFLSKPGVFGWNKIDQGSAFLIHHLPAILAEQAPKGNQLLDLGCGYGYLSVMASKMGDFDVTATDNNAVALHCSIQNFTDKGINGKVVASHCANTIEQSFDIVVCNPPFHTGFTTDVDLTPLFLQQAKKHLKPQGYAVFVVNSFIPLEIKAKDVFHSIEIVAKDKHFKVIKLR